ncbi:class I SAM-dependent methyltransferase [Bradyrhizobium jicamae]|uniref:class I SAM-dependent methyltransferase n=1 Tax=Bradyrhizobium jicamae TaxID=280332 RepID=UPI001BA92F11|nr:SAM-dependent methyltransferase [Bradyrhizobium jicamae]MBR0753711.1 class I SAM-dependent methyltransferase [Bradyrhizobium jicamae]
MTERPPSRTALGAAGYRAAHQQFEGGKVFSDPLARVILGDDADAIIASLSADPTQRGMRIFMAARSRFAEDCLGGAVSRGVRQAVVLGAGFDTFALRNPFSDLGLRVFEVDHPATQAWKRRRLSEVGLVVPASLTFAAVDFESDDLGQGLRDAGFEADRPAFFMWLGVVPYLERTAIAATLRYIAGVPKSEVVFDYSEPLENYPPERRDAVVALAARTAEIGEPWLSHFNPDEIVQELLGYGFDDIEDLGMSDLAMRLGAPAGAPERGPGPHLIRAAHKA